MDRLGRFHSGAGRLLERKEARNKEKNAAVPVLLVNRGGGGLAGGRGRKRDPADIRNKYI